MGDYTLQRSHLPTQTTEEFLKGNPLFFLQYVKAASNALLYVFSRGILTVSLFKVTSDSQLVSLRLSSHR